METFYLKAHTFGNRYPEWMPNLPLIPRPGFELLHLCISGATHSTHRPTAHHGGGTAKAASTPSGAGPVKSRGVITRHESPPLSTNDFYGSLKIEIKKNCLHRKIQVKWKMTM